MQKENKAAFAAYPRFAPVFHDPLDFLAAIVFLMVKQSQAAIADANK